MSTKQRDSSLLNELEQHRVAADANAKAIKFFLSSLDTPRSLAVWLLFENDEHQQLVDLEVNPNNYLSGESFRDDYVATEYLSKAKFLKLAVNKREVAMEKFFLMEELCSRTNKRFRNPMSDPLKTERTVWLHHAIKRKIMDILGPLVDYQEVFDNCNWGPGATTLIKRSQASSPAKFQFETGITRDLLPFFQSIAWTQYPNWIRHLGGTNAPVLCVGNKVTTAPKNAKTDRIIAIEAGLNLWLQKGVGEVFTNRLRKCGIYLRNQAVNQEFARKASISGDDGTVDMTSASDTVALEPVRELLPPAWFELCNTIRSHFGFARGSWLKYEKFSSMGNGFTFQLESLIFYAIAFECTKYVGADLKHVSVYGDDIIIPVKAQAIFSEMVSYFGFLLNGKKSFFSSPFRESCGAHYFGGLDCKPVYHKDRLTTVMSVYRHANAIRRLAHRINASWSCDVRFRRLFHFLISLVPKSIRFRIPEGKGDGGFISNFDEATPSLVGGGIEGYYYRHVSEPLRKVRRQYHGLLLAALWALELRGGVKPPHERPAIDRRLTRPVLLGVAKAFPSKSSSGLSDANALGMPGMKELRISKSIVHQWYELGTWE